MSDNFESDTDKYYQYNQEQFSFSKSDLYEPYKKYDCARDVLKLSKQEFESMNEETLRERYIEEYNKKKDTMVGIYGLKLHYNMTNDDKEIIEKIMQPYEKYTAYSGILSLGSMIWMITLGREINLPKRVITGQRLALLGYISVITAADIYRAGKAHSEIEQKGFFTKYNVPLNLTSI